MLLCFAIFGSSFSLGNWLFKEKTTNFEAACLAKYADTDYEYFLQKASKNISFYISHEKNNYAYDGMYELCDFEDEKMSPRLKKTNSSQFEILPPEGGYQEGKRYTLILKGSAMFSGDELKNATRLVFQIEKGSVATYRYNDDVIELDNQKLEVENEILKNIDTKYAVGDILLEKKGNEYAAYKITEIISSELGNNAKVEIPAVDEIFEELELYGEYHISKQDITANPELEVEILENVKNSGFFDSLMMAAYAADEKKDAPVDISLTFKDKSVDIVIKFTIKAGEKGLFGIPALKGHQVEITLTDTIETTITPNIDGVRNIDVSQKTHSTFKFEINITTQKNLSNDGEVYDRSINKIFAPENFKDVIAYKEYVKTITDTLAEISSDKSQGEIKLFDWEIPIPVIPCLIFGVEVNLKLTFGVAGQLNLGKDFKFTSISGITFENNKFSCYSDLKADKNSEGWTLSLTGKFEVKLGLVLKIKLSLISDEVAQINFDPQGGLYGEVFVTWPMKAPGDISDLKASYCYVEGGIYFEVNFNAYFKLKNFSLNIIDNVEFKKELKEKKIPLIRLGNNKIASGMVSQIAAVKVSNNEVTPPPILFSYYDVKSAKYKTETISVNELKFTVQDGSGLKVKNKKILLTGAAADKYTYVTATYLHTDGKTYSAIFKALLSGSMIEGKVSEYSTGSEVIAVADADVKIYKADDLTKVLNNVKTDDDGRFTFSVEKGEYSIVVSANGYHTLTSYQKVEEEEIKYTEHVLLISDTQVGSGTAGGEIKNAINGQVIPNATIRLRKNWNTQSGEYVEGFSTTTDSNGRYTISGVPVGYYTVEAGKQDFYTDYCNVIVLSLDYKTDHNFTLSPVLPDGYIQIVLRWGQYPLDLDSHLIGKTPFGDNFNVFYSQKSYSYDGEEYANLDVDDTNSYGPETITIVKPIAGKSIYAVHDYSNRGNSDSEKLSYSGAFITVFNGGRQVAAYNVPTGLIGNYWVVFEITSDGIITPINAVTNTKPN